MGSQRIRSEVENHKLKRKQWAAPAASHPLILAERR